MASRDFKGIWIPREVWLHPSLKWYDKIVLMEVDSFTRRGADCFFSDKHLADFVGVSERSIRTSITRLIDEGLLEHQGFDGRKRFLRSLLPTYTARAADLSGNSFRADRQDVPKKKTKEQTKEQTKEELVYPWDSQEFKGLWKTWLQERKDRKLKKYTPRGEQAALHKLYNDSNGDMAVAVAAIQNSIAHGYQGLFPKPTRTNGARPQLNRQAVDDWLNQ
jgi:hypothetical protein